MQKSDTKEELRWRWGTKRRADKAGGETGLPPSLLAPQKHTLRLFPLQSCLSSYITPVCLTPSPAPPPCPNISTLHHSTSDSAVCCNRRRRLWLVIRFALDVVLTLTDWHGILPKVKQSSKFTGYERDTVLFVLYCGSKAPNFIMSVCTHCNKIHWIFGR